MENKQIAIAAELRRRIRDGEYVDRLPISTDLAAMFGVNIKTIHKALAHLTAEGLIERKRRDGTRIRAGVRAEQHLVEVLFEGFATIFSHPFWSEIWNGMTEVLLAEGFLPVLHMLRTVPGSSVLQLEDFETIPSAGKIILGIGEKRLFGPSRRPSVRNGKHSVRDGTRLLGAEERRNPDLLRRAARLFKPFSPLTAPSENRPDRPFDSRKNRDGPIFCYTGCRVRSLISTRFSCRRYAPFSNSFGCRQT